MDSFTENENCEALALPHHTVRNAFIHDWAYTNPKYVKVVEVCSVHGTSLFTPQNELNYLGSIDNPPVEVNGSSIIDALNMGFNFGLYASGDSHDGHPGHSITHTGAQVGHQYPFTIHHSRAEHPYPNPLTAIYTTSNLNRTSVFKSLQNLMTYANSDFGRPIVFFKINNQSFEHSNKINVLNVTAPRILEIFLAQDGSLESMKNIAAPINSLERDNWNARCEIIKNGKLFKTINISSPIVNITVVDDEEIIGTQYSDYIEKDGQYYINDYSTKPINPAELNTNGNDYYLLRIISENGRVTFLGPMWVNYN